MRPGVDRGRVPAPGAQLVAAGEDAVAAGDDFFGIDVPDRGRGQDGGAEGGHFLAQCGHRVDRYIRRAVGGQAVLDRGADLRAVEPRIDDIIDIANAASASCGKIRMATE